MQILTLSRAICSDIFHSLSAPATLAGAPGSPCSGCRELGGPAREPPSRQGTAAASSPGSSANSLSFEIEFGPGEGWLGPAPLGPAAGLTFLPENWAGAGLVGAASEGDGGSLSQPQGCHGTGFSVTAGILSTLFPGHPTRKSGSSNFGGQYCSQQLYVTGRLSCGASAP